MMLMCTLNTVSWIFGVVFDVVEDYVTNIRFSPYHYIVMVYIVCSSPSSSFSQLQYNIDHQLFRIRQNAVHLFCLVSLLRKYYIVIQYCKCKDFLIKKIKLPVVFKYLALLSLIIIVIDDPALLVTELQKKYDTSIQWCIHNKLI